MEGTRTLIFQIRCCLFVICFSYNSDGALDCSFPEFLWNAGGDETVPRRTWFTEQKHVSNSYDYESRKLIVARETELLLSDQYSTACESGRCVKTETTMRMECVRNDGVDKIRVRRFLNGYDDIMCFRFVKRSKNIVQLWMSRPSDTDMANLCADSELHRQDWPWIAELPQEWQPCPLTGGFEFRANLSYQNHKKMVCERIWKMSRLESECVVGDGMQFLFPENHCSIFHTKEKEQSLRCVGWWYEEQYIFIIASEEGKSPQYAIRMPRSYDATEMSVQLYYSPVCPLNERGSPPGQIMYMILTLVRADPSTCMDENSKICEQVAEDGCRSVDPQRNYGQICRRTCGLCEMAPSNATECYFPQSHQGNFLLFERDRLESISLASGRLESSVFGNMICKRRHRDDTKYKFISLFKNGCQPRYTCVELQTDDTDQQQRLKFRISRSMRTNRSLELCRFEPDPPPLTTKYRSPEFKVLTPVSRCRQFSCGLGGLVHLRLTFTDGATCDGTLSDWNPFTCTLSPRLALSYRNCANDNQKLLHREFTCEAYIDIRESYRLLFTKEISPDGEEITYSCLLITLKKNTTDGQQRSFWTSAAILSRDQCSRLQTNIDLSVYKKASVTFQILTEALEKKPCIIMTKSAKPQGSAGNIRYTVRKNVKESKYGKPNKSPSLSSKPADSGATCVPAGIKREVEIALMVVALLTVALQVKL